MEVEGEVVVGEDKLGKFDKELSEWVLKLWVVE